jgi:hypothetical protein
MVTQIADGRHRHVKIVLSTLTFNAWPIGAAAESLFKRQLGIYIGIAEVISRRRIHNALRGMCSRE